MTMTKLSIKIYSINKIEINFAVRMALSTFAADLEKGKEIL